VLRLGPALTLMLAVYSIVCLVVLHGAEARDHLIDVAIAFFYVSNWARALGIHPPDFLGHTWSLGIEEQFYLAWPLVLYTLLRTGTPRRRIALFAIGIAIACCLTRIGYLLSGKTIERVYNGLDTRADCLMVGCALGTVLACGLLGDAARARLRRMLAVATPLMVLWLVVFAVVGDWQSRWIYYWGLTAVALAAGTLIVDVLIDPGGRLAAMLSSRWLVFTGSISYGLYLWHYPIYRGLAALDLGRWAVFAIGVPASFAIATLSYRFLERPILNLARPSAWRSARPGAFGRSAAASARD
jgi:peptidoglycan/LPS O-acetylase OafA/YrhL